MQDVATQTDARIGMSQGYAQGRKRGGEEGARWFVMNAYKSEKKAEEKLAEEGGMEHFVPKRYAVRCYHGVKSKRLVPAIPGLVFVRASLRRIAEFKKEHGFLRFATWRKSTGTEFLVVPDRQMEDFIKVASRVGETAYYRPEEIDIRKGARVRILGGPLDGVEGTFMRVKGKRDRRIVVVLEGVMAVAAEVRPDLVEVIGKNA